MSAFEAYRHFDPFAGGGDLTRAAALLSVAFPRRAHNKTVSIASQWVWTTLAASIRPCLICAAPGGVFCRNLPRSLVIDTARMYDLLISMVAVADGDLGSPARIYRHAFHQWCPGVVDIGCILCIGKMEPLREVMGMLGMSPPSKSASRL